MIKDEMEKSKVAQVISTLEQELVIWELCDILYPGVKDLDQDFLEDVGFLLDQRMRLAEWLRKYATILFGDLYNGMDKSALGLLKKGLIADASNAAMKEGSYWLAVALATEPHLILDFDECPDVLNAMPKDTSDIFALLSGNMRKLSWLTKEKVLNLSNFDWFQFFALYLWYEGPVRSLLPVPVHRAVREFEALMREAAVDLECPLPRSEVSSISNLAMHLLKMYSCTGYPINVILSPRTWSPDCLDYKLVWLLMRDMRYLGYPADKDLERSLCLSFVGMLEAIGFSAWATYILCILPSTPLEAKVSVRTPSKIALSSRLAERNPIPNQEDLGFMIMYGVDDKLFGWLGIWRDEASRNPDPIGNLWRIMRMFNFRGCYYAFLEFLKGRDSFSVFGQRRSHAADRIRSLLRLLRMNRKFLIDWGLEGKMVCSYLTMIFQHENHEELGIEQEINQFLESVVKFVPTNMHQCAFLLEMALNAQRIIQLLLMESKMEQEFREKIEHNLVPFLEIAVPKEYFEGLRSFINTNLMNTTGPFRINLLAPEDTGIEQ